MFKTCFISIAKTIFKEKYIYECQHMYFTSGKIHKEIKIIGSYTYLPFFSILKNGSKLPQALAVPIKIVNVYC